MDNETEAPKELTPEEQQQWADAGALDDKSTQAYLRRAAAGRREEDRVPTSPQRPERAPAREKLETRTAELETKGKQAKQAETGLQDFARNLQEDVDDLNKRQEALGLKRQAIEKATSDYEMTLRVVGTTLEPELYSKMKARADALDQDIKGYQARVDEWDTDYSRKAIDERSAKLEALGRLLDRAVVPLQAEAETLNQQIETFNQRLKEGTAAAKAAQVQEPPAPEPAPQETKPEETLKRLADYKEGEGYRVADALAEGKVTSTELSQAGFKDEDVLDAMHERSLAQVRQKSLDQLKDYKVGADQYDLEKALRDKVDHGLLEQAGFSEPEIRAAEARTRAPAIPEIEKPDQIQIREVPVVPDALKPYKEGDGYRIAEALRYGAVTPAELRRIGFEDDAIRRAGVASVILKRLDMDYRDTQGNYDIAKALRDGAATPYTLERAGFDPKDIERAQKEKTGWAASVSPERLKDIGLGLIPVVGTVRSTKTLNRDWDKLSPTERALGIGQTALSAGADVLILAGGVGLVIKGLRGGAVGMQSLSVESAAETSGVASTAARAGTPIPRIAGIAGYSDEELREVTKMVRSVTSDPKVAKGLEKVPIETAATPEGAGRLVAQMQDIGKAPSKVQGMVVVNQGLPTKNAVQIARTLKQGGVDEVSIKQVLRGKLGGDEQARTARAVAYANKETQAQATKRIAPIFQATGNKEVRVATRTLGRALREQGVKFTVETENLGAKAKGISKTVRELRMEPPPARATVGMAPPGGKGFYGGTQTKIAAGTGTGTSVTRTLTRTGTQRLVIAISPGYVSDMPATTSARPGWVAKPVPTTQPSTTRQPAPLKVGKPTPAPVTPATPQRITPATPTPLKVGAPIPTPREIPTPSRAPSPAQVERPTRVTVKAPAITPGPAPSEATVKVPTPTPAPTPASTPAPTPSPQVVKAKVTVRTQKATAVVAPPFAAFRLPGGASLPAGKYPLILQWAQGSSLVERNLVTGATRYRRNPGDPTRNPWETLKVLQVSPKPPKRQRLDLGAVDVLIDGKSLRFVASLSGGAIRARPFTRRPRRSIA